MKINNKSWFTLIEMIVAITIFSLMMVTVITVFVMNSKLNNKVEVNRQISENIKNIVDIIWEDIRKNWINFPSESSGSTLVVWSWATETEYYLVKNSDSWYDAVNNISEDCDTIADNCTLFFKNYSSWTLVNSWVQFKDLHFTYIPDNKSVQMNFIILPATLKWIHSELIEKNTIDFQTTFSERYLKYKN